MGSRVTGWLKGLLGGRKDSRKTSRGGDEWRAKKHWCFKSVRPQDPLTAAAQAAAAAVKLTSHGRGNMAGGVRVRNAVVRIQTAFRGYLAKTTVRAHKSQAHKSRAPPCDDQRFRQKMCSRISLERFDETRSDGSEQISGTLMDSAEDMTCISPVPNPELLLLPPCQIPTCIPPVISLERFDETRSDGSEQISGTLMDSAEDMTCISPVPNPELLLLPPCQIPTCIPPVIPAKRERCRWSILAQPSELYGQHAVHGGVRRFLNRLNCMTNMQSFQAKVRSQNTPCSEMGPSSASQHTVHGVSEMGPSWASQHAVHGVVRRFLNRLNCMNNMQSFQANVRSQNMPCSEMGPSSVSLSGVGMKRPCTMCRAQEVEAYSFQSVRFLYL